MSVMMKCRIASLALLTIAPAARAQSPDSLRDRLQARFAEWQAASGNPGATAAIVLADGRTITLTAGFADTTRHIPITSAHRLHGGSTGKTFVAAIIMQLVDEGRLGLDDKVSRWFSNEPWFARFPNAKDLTVRMLLNHSGGVPDHVTLRQVVSDVLNASPDRVWTPAEILGYLDGAKPLSPAGAERHYADTNYILLGMVIEAIASSTYYAELERRILKPLGLSNTIPTDHRAIANMSQGYSGGVERAWLGYAKDSLTTPPRPGTQAAADEVIENGAFVVNTQFEWTGGGLVETSEDLAHWTKAVYEARVFSRKLLDESVRDGLGTFVGQTPQGPRYGHGGFFPGYRTAMAYFPNSRIAIAVHVNTSVGGPKSAPQQFISEAIAILAK
jgi:D-alanyl-D-alanine carboxypeptidase